MNENVQGRLDFGDSAKKSFHSRLALTSEEEVLLHHSTSLQRKTKSRQEQEAGSQPWACSSLFRAVDPLSVSFATFEKFLIKAVK